MNTPTQTYVAYYRVSTDKQGNSGLGLEAQQRALTNYDIVGSYTEVESGKKTNRVQLEAALEACRDGGHTLVIAKLDRLSRNLKFICDLMEADVEFVCADMPMANKLTLHVMAAFAQHEAEVISQRTKAALHSLKQQGVKLGAAREGHWEKRSQHTYQGRQVSRTEVDKRLMAQVGQLREQGVSYEKIANTINQQGWTTATGKQWSKSTIHRAFNHNLRAA